MTAYLPYSGYSYVEAFFSMNQACWTAAHVNAYRYFGGVTRMIPCDSLKTGVEKHGRDEVVLNKSYSCSCRKDIYLQILGHIFAHYPISKYTGTYIIMQIQGMGIWHFEA